jgi:hypothetical protein
MISLHPLDKNFMFVTTGLEVAAKKEYPVSAGNRNPFVQSSVSYIVDPRVSADMEMFVTA